MKRNSLWINPLANIGHERLLQIIEKFSLYDIFNADEIRLHERGLSDRGPMEGRKNLEGG